MSAAINRSSFSRTVSSAGAGNWASPVAETTPTDNRVAVRTSGISTANHGTLFRNIVNPSVEFCQWISDTCLENQTQRSGLSGSTFRSQAVNQSIRCGKEPEQPTVSGDPLSILDSFSSCRNGIFETRLVFAERENKGVAQAESSTIQPVFVRPVRAEPPSRTFAILLEGV
jgi:hypothetical protein